jgi:hypothetical protein
MTKRHKPKPAADQPDATKPAEIASRPTDPQLDWGTIQRLALSYNGYEASGSFGSCADIGNGMADRFAKEHKVEGATEDLRTALFFEQRRWRHYGDAPDEDSMVYIRALVDELRRRMGDDWIREQIESSKF